MMGYAEGNESNLKTLGPIFVVGAPRTGTTLTMEILNRHSMIHLYNEVHYNERIADTMPCEGALDHSDLRDVARRLMARSPWKKNTGSVDAELDDLIVGATNLGGGHAAILEAFLAGESHAQGKNIWGDSSPQDVLYMARLKRWYPSARFIGVVRDPRGFLASYKNYYRKKLKSYRNRFSPLANSILWRSYMNSLHEAKSSALGSDVYMLHYEDLVDSPEYEIKQLCAFLGVSYEESMIEVGRQNSSYFPVKEDKNQQGISAGSRDRWRSELSSIEVWLVQKICGKELGRLGYEAVPVRLGFKDVGSMIRILLLLPARVFNLMFRTGKPFTMAKLKRILGRSG